MKSKYREALDYVYSFTDYEVQSGFLYSPERFDLKRVERLLALMGNPHHAFKAIHIAGTKGKGSTAAMIASILGEAGYRTALYTSPHLHTFRERIQINSEMISQDQVADGVDILRSVVPQVPEITTFELITALAFNHFAQQECQMAVVEVGMGGRLDATNVLDPMVSVITPISYDHTMYLGDTLAAIATEKAGIIKPGVPVVSAPQPSEAQEVIQRIAAERGCVVVLIGRNWHWQNVHTSAEGQRFAAWPDGETLHKPTYELSLLGRHQQVNATTALATVAQLRQAGIEIPDRAIHIGLQSAQWPGRLEVLGRHPWVIVDGAHNGDSMQKLRTGIVELFPHRNAILVFGASADKDIAGMLDAILPVVHRVLVTQTNHPRAATVGSLVERFALHGKRATAVPMGQVLGEALRLAGQNDLICATGSLFVVADFRAAWFKHKGESLPPSDAE